MTPLLNDSRQLQPALKIQNMYAIALVVILLNTAVEMANAIANIFYKTFKTLYEPSMHLFTLGTVSYKTD